jgi:hypothetical protein
MGEVPDRASISAGMPATLMVFVVGCARSGTTWVRSILDRHDRVVSGPESHLFPVLYPKLTARSARREATLAAFDKQRHQGLANQGPHRWIDRASLEDLLANVEARGLTGDAAARHVIGGILEAFARTGNGRVVVEKTPGHLMYAGRILKWWPNARIIEVMRDGRDVCVSLAHKSKARRWGPAHREEQIERWTTAVRHGMTLRATPLAKGRWHVVRYEDLMSDPTLEIRRMYEFVGLAADDAFIDQVAEETAFASAKRMGAGHHLRKGEVGEWRREFTPEDVEAFAEAAGELLVAHGYEAAAPDGTLPKRKGPPMRAFP